VPSVLVLLMTVAVLGMHGIRPHGTFDVGHHASRSTGIAAHDPDHASHQLPDPAAASTATDSSARNDHGSMTELMTRCAALVAASTTDTGLTPLVGPLTGEMTRSLCQLLRSPDPPVPRLALTIPD
jgi:hypothetical protein